MALSDSCFEFLDAVGAAARQLAEEVHCYSAPSSPLRYGEEIDALRRACTTVADAPYDAEASARLVRLAASVMRYHDTPPGAPEQIRHREKMNALIQLLQANLDAEDAEAVPAIVENVVEESRFSEAAAARLRAMLPRLGKAAYDSAVQIISDIGTAAVKKMLGL